MIHKKAAEEANQITEGEPSGMDGWMVEYKKITLFPVLKERYAVGKW